MRFAELIARHNPSQSHWELNELLEDLDRRRLTGPAIDIGAHRGGSARVWRDVLRSEIVVAIDWNLDMLEGDLERIVPILGRSQDVATHAEVQRCLSRRPVDFLFIDGGHLRGEVLADFASYGPLVRPGGAIALHDVAVRENPDCEVYLVWDELRHGRRSKEIREGALPGTGIGVIYP